MGDLGNRGSPKLMGRGLSERGIKRCWRLAHDCPNKATQLPSHRDERCGRHVVLKSNNLVTLSHVVSWKYSWQSCHNPRREMHYEKVNSCRSSFTQQHVWQLRGNMEGQCGWLCVHASHTECGRRRSDHLAMAKWNAYDHVADRACGSQIME